LRDLDLSRNKLCSCDSAFRLIKYLGLQTHWSPVQTWTCTTLRQYRTNRASQVRTTGLGG